jgi:hypothetical protein
MRILSIFCAVVLLSCVALAQTPVLGPFGPYTCGGPYIPMVTTPQVSLQTVSADPVGASNATYGLHAGATNATLSLSNVNGNVGGVYTQPVWYAGGTTPLISSPAVQLPMPVAQHQMIGRRMFEHEHGASSTRPWVYYASEEETASAAAASVAAKSGRHATRTISNQDVVQVNQNNGSVKYDGKTEKIQ